MEFDAICFGAVNMDRLYRVNRIAQPEEESYILGLKVTDGGAAANTAVGLARLGLNVGFIGKLSDDIYGRMLLQSFLKDKVDTNSLIVAEKGITGIVIGFVDKNGSRALYVRPGVNNSLCYEEININYARNCSILHLTPFVGNLPFHAQKETTNLLSERCMISLDPGDLYTRRGIKALKPILSKCFLLSLNRRETERITGKPYKEGAKMLLDIGPKIVVVKLGKNGCFVTSREDSFSLTAFKTKVVDATGAGEAFNTGFLWGLIQGKKLMECGKLGNYVASCCVSKMGAREGLPFLAQLHKAKILDSP